MVIGVELRVPADFFVVACLWWLILAYGSIAIPSTGEPCLLALLKRVAKIALSSLSVPYFYPPPPPTPAGHGLPPSTSDSVSQPAHASPETCRVPRTMRHGDSESHNIKNHESLDKIWIIEPSRRHAIECAVGPEPRRMSRAVDILTPASQTVWAMPKICRLHVLCATMGAK